MQLIPTLKALMMNAVVLRVRVWRALSAGVVPVLAKIRAKNADLLTHMCFVNVANVVFLTCI